MTIATMDESAIEKRVYYHDTDCGGVVYYANYLKYLEEGRTEHLRNRGVDFRRLIDEGVLFAVAKVEISYKAPAHYQDLLTIHTRVEKVKMSAIRFHQYVMRGETLIVEAVTYLLTVSRDTGPVAIPEAMKRALVRAD